MGAYHLLACADDTQIVAETNENNNCKASAAKVKIQTFDLVETNLSNPPATTKRRDRFSITDTAKNRGTGRVGASTTRYFLSRDLLKNTGDKLLPTQRPIPALASGAISTGTVNLTVPFGMAFGSYHVLACADDRKVVPEDDENNNCRASGKVNIVP